MSEKSNKDIVTAYFNDAWIPGKDFDKYVSDDYVRHMHGQISSRGFEGLAEENKYLHERFTDWVLHLYDVISEEDKVVARFTIDGTHVGEWHGISPTNKRVQVHGIDIFRISNGRIVEQWVEIDIWLLERQLNAE